MILDATCSAKRLWPEFADIRMDINPETHPDVVGSCTAIPFPDQYFKMVYCDPPYLVGKGPVWRAEVMQSGRLGNRFSVFDSMDAWRDFATKAMAEFRRVLKPRGILTWKLMDGSRSHGRVIDYKVVLNAPGFRLVEDVAVPSNGPMARANAKRWGTPISNVHYVTMERLYD
jgi:hypothetical protein